GTRIPKMPVPLAQRGFEIGDQIVGVLDADRQPQQIRRYWAVGPFDRGAVLEEAFDPAERGRALPYFDPGRRRDRRGFAATYPNAQHAAEPALHLARRDPMPGIAFQPWVEHREHLRVPRQAIGDLHRRSAGALDPRVQRT